MEFLATGSPTFDINEAQARVYLRQILEQLGRIKPLRRVLILPPDITRLHSWAGFLTCALVDELRSSADITILPALGTHRPMTGDELSHMFPGLAHSLFRAHDWRYDIVTLGTVPAEFIHQISEGKLNFSANIQVNRLLTEQPWDAIFSVGQLVPHEVIGIANYNKNVFVGTGGSDLINKSHWLGAVYGIERIMGKADTPVRAMLNYGSDHFAKHLPIVYIHTVRARDASGNLVTRGLYSGDDSASFFRGAELCRQVNLDLLDRAPKKVVVYLDPGEFKSTWLGNKAVYRTRMAIADAGELIVLAPGVREFGEDHAIDGLIRRFGYRGTPTTLAKVQQDPALAANLSAAAHLIHGSSEGRFAITYCPGHLTREEIEGVGFQYADLSAMMDLYNPNKLRDGWNVLPGGEEIYYISNPALGLWGTKDKFAVNEAT